MGSVNWSVSATLTGKAGENMRSLAGVLARGDCSQFGLRMVQESMDEFFAGVARGPDDGDLNWRSSLMFGLFCVFLSRIERNKKPRRRNGGVLKEGRLAFAELEVLAGAGLTGFFRSRTRESRVRPSALRVGRSSASCRSRARAMRSGWLRRWQCRLLAHDSHVKLLEFSVV